MWCVIKRCNDADRIFNACFRISKYVVLGTEKKSQLRFSERQQIHGFQETESSSPTMYDGTDEKFIMQPKITVLYPALTCRTFFFFYIYIFTSTPESLKQRFIARNNYYITVGSLWLKMFCFKMFALYLEVILFLNTLQMHEKHFTQWNFLKWKEFCRRSHSKLQRSDRT